MKKILYLLIIGVITSIIFAFGGCESFNYTEYPLAQQTKDYKIIYNGNTYVYSEEMNSKEWFLNYNEMKLVASVWTGDIIPRKSPIYVSDLDTEENILNIYGPAFGASGYYVKEGFELPDKYEASIGNVFIDVNVPNKDKSNQFVRVYLSGVFAEEVTYYDILGEEEILEITAPQKLLICPVYFELKNCRCLMIGRFSLFDIEGKVYLGKIPVSSEVARCHKVKDEYQEAFRSAITELETLVETSESAT